MNTAKTKQLANARRAHRTRARIHGTATRPRLSVHRTLKHISAQLINDDAGTTLAFADDKKIPGAKSQRATAVGTLIAEQAKAKGVEAVIFDRGAFRYHGRVKAVAEGARAAGLQF